jgi:hypothetical protein
MKPPCCTVREDYQSVYDNEKNLNAFDYAAQTMGASNRMWHKA